MADGIFSVMPVDGQQHPDGRRHPRRRDIRILTKVSLLQILWHLNQQGQIASLTPDSIQSDDWEVQNQFPEASPEMAAFFAIWMQHQKGRLIDQIQQVTDQRQLVGH